ncbi:MAG: aldo/keto reductase [Thalassovita sp.]
MTIGTRRVGKTDVYVTNLSFGCSSLGNMGRLLEDQEATDVLQHAWAAGIRYFDTAPHYGRGLSEARLGDFLKQKARADFVVSTKVGRVLRPGPQLADADGFLQPLPNAVHYDYSAQGLRESFEGSCDRLNLSEIDILFVHDLGSYTHGAENAGHMDAFLGSGLAELQRLKSTGKIKAFGLGVNETQVCLDVMAQAPLDVILLAGRLSLLDRSGVQDGLTELAQKQGTSLVLGGIFNSGILATGAKPGATYDYGPAPAEVMQAVEALEEEARAVGLSLAEAALQFALNHQSACSTLIGTGKVSSLERNLKAAQITLTPAAKNFVTL